MIFSSLLQMNPVVNHTISFAPIPCGVFGAGGVCLRGECRFDAVWTAQSELVVQKQGVAGACTTCLEIGGTIILLLLMALSRYLAWTACMCVCAQGFPAVGWPVSSRATVHTTPAYIILLAHDIPTYRRLYSFVHLTINNSAYIDT